MAALLSDYLQEQAARRFEWGVADCFTFAAGWLDQLKGKSALNLWCGQYHDAASADRFIAAGGGFATIVGQWMIEHYGVRPCKPGRGIVVLAQCQKRKVMGLRVDDLSLAFRTESGLLITKRARVLKEWGF